MSEVNSCCGTTCDKAKVVAEYDALRAQVALLNALIVDIQRVTVSYLQPNSYSNERYINVIVGLLDGPQQRAAQATPEQCLVTVQYAAVEKFVTALSAAWRSDWGTREISEFADDYVRGLV